MGFCHLVGAGPGDPGLFTIRGRECVEQAEVIVYDYLSNAELLASAPEGCEFIYAGKTAGQHTLTQDEINATLVEKCREGKRVVRLKGGDPYLFGRGGEEAEALAAAGFPFEVVPGITSAVAGPAYAGIPVTHRDFVSSVTIFTGHEDPEKSESSLDYEALVRSGGTLVMLMGVGRLGKISRELLDAGAPPDLPVALVRWATTGRQETLTGELATIADKVEKAGFKPPAVTVIGKVAGLRDQLDWFEKRPLFGKKIAVTRTRKQAGTLIRRLRELGADAYELPTIRIEPPEKPEVFREAVEQAHHYDWIVFTSPNGVDAFMKQFDELFSDARAIGGARFAAIGPATAARLKAWRYAVDLQPDEFVAEKIVEAFKEHVSLENLRILLPRAADARDVLPKELEALGALVDDVAAYRTVPETGDPTGGVKRFRQEGADMITFTSSSTATNFAALELTLPRGLKIASIGPITSETLDALGFTVDVEAGEYDIPGLVRAILDYYAAEET